MTTILAIDAAGPRAGIAIVDAAGRVWGRQVAPAGTGLTETLPSLLQACLAQAETRPEAVAVTLGPGSFTGMRNAIALAQGYAGAAGLPLWGVTVAEAFAMALPGLRRPLWVALRARRNRLFLLRGIDTKACADAEIPKNPVPVALAGDAAAEVAARLAAAGCDVMLTNAKLLEPAWVARAAWARQTADLPAHPIQPLYVDPPEARLAQSRPQPL